MANAWLLFSHKLNDAQIKELEKKFNCREIHYLPEELQEIWSCIPPEGELDVARIREFSEYLRQSSTKGDIVLIQGDYGMVYALVRWCAENERIPIYATTYRVTDILSENDYGVQTISSFKHINFRRYPL